MSSSMLAFVPDTVFGVGVVVLAGVALLPQLQVLRRGELAGFSAGTAGLAALTMACWCAYTISVRDFAAFTGSALPGAGWVGALVLLQRRGGVDRAVLLGWLAACAVVPLLLVGAGVAGGVAATGSVLWMWPQLRKAARQPELSGVSAASFALLAAEAGMWVAWGIVQGRIVYLPAASLQLVVLSLIAVQAWRKRSPDRG